MIDKHKWGRFADEAEIKGLQGRQLTIHVAEEDASYLVFGHDEDNNVLYMLTEWGKKQ